jgi:hypothetical protein
LPWPVKFPVPETWEEYVLWKKALRRCAEAERKRVARNPGRPVYVIPEIQEPAGERPANYAALLKAADISGLDLWQFLDTEPVLRVRAGSAAEEEPQILTSQEMALAEEGLALLEASS